MPDHDHAAILRYPAQLGSRGGGAAVDGAITLIGTDVLTAAGLVELVVEQLTVTAARQSFGKQFAGLRGAANLTQYEFARLVGYSRSTVANIERGRQHPSPVFCRKSDEVLSTGGVLRAALDELEELRRETHREAAASAQDERRDLVGTQPVPEATHRGGTGRRHILTAIGAGAVALSPLAGQSSGVRELVLNAAHSSALILSSIDAPKIEDRTLDEARQDLHRLATDYVVNLDLNHILPELVILRDRLYSLLAWYGQRPGDARELHLLLGATCVLLASISHDLDEPGAAMIQTRTALASAELAGHAGLITWVYCTRASIASWSGSADDVLHHAQRARAVGLSGVGAIRLAGLEARALAQSGQHQQVAEVLRTAHARRDKSPAIDSLRDLGEAFTFSAARQHYYNAAAYAHTHDWKSVEREASRVISFYGAPETGQCWPVTMTLSQIHLAQAQLILCGPEGARDALAPVFAISDEQRIPQAVQALGGISAQLSSTVFANLPVARDLDEAIRNFRPTVDN
ncbi:MAG: helix-turn-helix transcriptional regulator [Pseudonocardiaceae bacterium]